MSEVLHITAHLGGGVGNALAVLVGEDGSRLPALRRTIICLEKPEKSQFLERIQRSGCEVLICPSEDEIISRVILADIVQVEWWNHPAIIKALCTLRLIPMRLLVWSHISGLANPVIPEGLFEAAQRFVFTSPCSLSISSLRDKQHLRQRLRVISSAGGFEKFPLPDLAGKRKRKFSAGYIGTLSFSKLHPDFIGFLSAVDLPGFRVRMLGDTNNRLAIEQQAHAAGCAEVVEFGGYVTDVISELSNLDVLTYLLNPRHYGTAEIALLEAMAMGVVPVVFDNPAETCVVKNRENGIVVSSIAEFASAIQWLSRHPESRERISRDAVSFVRQKFTTEKMQTSFSSLYHELLCESKRAVDFSSIFGNSPDAWFLSCQSSPNVFMDDGSVSCECAGIQYDLIEKTKGSVFHFLRYYPDDRRLSAWAKSLSENLP